MPRPAETQKSVRTLAIETSSARGSVALLDDDGSVAAKAFGEGSRHGRKLLPCVNELLGGEPAGVGLVAVSAGPGSYTGLRVGITFAKTFAIETGVPVVGVSSLDAIAANVTQPCELCVVADARLGKVFAALYDLQGKKVLGDIAASPGEVAAGLQSGTLVIGGGLKRYREIFAQAAEVSDDESIWWPTAVNVGRLGRAKFADAGGEDPHALVPRYLGRPQAEVKWEQSQSASGRK